MSFPAIDAIIKREGEGFTNHPSDRGGPTKFGITLTTLGGWRGVPVSADDVKDLEREEAVEIYEELFILAPGFDGIENLELLDLVVDCGVLHGPRRAAEWLQTAVGSGVDGIVGPITLAAVNEASSRALIIILSVIRIRSLANLVKRDPSQAVFIEGWMNRATEFLF